MCAIEGKYTSTYESGMIMLEDTTLGAPHQVNHTTVPVPFSKRT